MLSLIVSRGKKKSTFIYIIMTALFFIEPTYAGLIEELPGVAWERRFGDYKFDHEYKAVAVSKEGEVWIAVRSRPIGNFKNWNLWLWKVNQAGEMVKEIEIRDPKGELVFPDINHLLILDNKDIFLVAELVHGLPSLVKLSKSGKLLYVKQIAETENDVSIFKIVPTSDGYFILVGRKSSDAFAMKVDAAANIVWEKVFDRGKIEAFFDGVPTEDGGVFLVGNSWSGDPFFTGPSDLITVKLNLKGNIQSEIIFPGRYPSLARGQNGGFVIVYDKDDSTSQDIWIQAFNHELKDFWKARLITVDRGLAKFKVAPVSSGGFVVVGSKNFNLWVSRIDEEGKVIWNYLADRDIARRSPIFGLISYNEVFIVLSSVYSENETRQTNNKIGLIKFIQK